MFASYRLVWMCLQCGKKSVDQAGIFSLDAGFDESCSSNCRPIKQYAGCHEMTNDVKVTPQGLLVELNSQEAGEVYVPPKARPVWAPDAFSQILESSKFSETDPELLAAAEKAIQAHSARQAALMPEAAEKKDTPPSTALTLEQIQELKKALEWIYTQGAHAHRNNIVRVAEDTLKKVFGQLPPPEEHGTFVITL